MSRTRLFVLVVSAPIIAFALVGGVLGQAMARDETYAHLRVFQDVISLVLNNYVEDVRIDRVMTGAMRGLADGLDADSAYLTPDQVKVLEGHQNPGPAGVGLQLTRQYYLRVVSARDDSPASRAGLRPGDYVRAIDDTPTRNMSAWEGDRRLRGAPGTKVRLTVIRGNAADPHAIELVRDVVPTAPSAMKSRMADAQTGYVRVIDFGSRVAERLTAQIAELQKTGATRVILDLRGAAWGDYENGIAAARLFVRSGTLTVRQGKGDVRETIAANAGDGGLTLPVALLVDQGTSGAAEIFAGALAGHGRATLVGEKTLGRAAHQKLVKLADGSGLWLSHIRYLTPGGTPIHEKGLTPDVEVDQPDVEFGQPAPAGDPTMQKAIDALDLARKTAA